MKRKVRAQVVIIGYGRYILLKHHDIRRNRFFWGLPAGGVEDGETEEEAAIREAKEETGLEIELLPFKYEVISPQETNMYQKKVTFIGYPVGGRAQLGYDPEEEMKALYQLVDIKWQDLDALDSLDAITKGDVLPCINYLANHLLSKKVKIIKCEVLIQRKHYLESELFDLNEQLLNGLRLLGFYFHNKCQVYLYGGFEMELSTEINWIAFGRFKEINDKELLNVVESKL